MTFDEFESCLFEVSGEIPEQFYIELNSGIMASREQKIHPKSKGDELCIMGQYCVRQGLGRYIVLYYGSFLKQYGQAPDAFWKKQIRRVLKHELTHHLESLAGEKELEIEDKIQLIKYLKR